MGKPKQKPNRIPKAKPRERIKAGDSKNLAQRLRVFATRYALHGNGKRAAIEAGYSERTAAQQATGLLKLEPVQKHLEELRAAAAEKAGIDGAEVLSRLALIANADANELSQVRRLSCRYCHGEGFKRQYKPSEWAKAEAGDSDRPPASWYDPRKPPHPECPECFGEGLEDIFLPDTRNLSPEARQAYAGAEVTRNGLRIRTHDKVTALVKLGENAGLFSKKVEHSGPGGGPMETWMKIEFVDPPKAKGSKPDA